jgi:heptosyltransferase-2
MRSILIIQTAFAGDLILTTPLIEASQRSFENAAVDVLAIPSTASLLANNPGIREVISYDKKNRRPGLPTLMRQLARRKYDVCISPHRSLRSALLARATGACRRVGFDRSAAAWLYTDTVSYDGHAHEADRNLALLSVFGSEPMTGCRPALFPSGSDREAASRTLPMGNDRPLLCLAPGSVWATKRWSESGFLEVARAFCTTHLVVLIGGAQDVEICDRIAKQAASENVVSIAGQLSFLASAALIDRAEVLVSNDSAPVHIASAMKTPVVEIFGATSPAFGFTPYDVVHRIVQRDDLDCKPCAIHGGDRCPVKTFDCMKGLPAATVIAAVHELTGKSDGN